MKKMFLVLAAALVCGSALAAPTKGAIQTEGMKIAWAK